MDQVFFADDVAVPAHEPGFRTEEWGTWHGFSLNPGLRRRQDYLQIQSFVALNPRGRNRLTTSSVRLQRSI